MSEGSPGFRAHLTLILCTILHAFTHAYGAMLVPLYLLMVRDLHLDGVRQASLIVTINGFVYCMFSYFAGILADRFNRKALLGVGLLGNALAIAAMGLTRQYEWLIIWGICAGLFGTLFHPAANALVPAHYPRNPGMAIGLLGMGSGIGFFAGPQFAGWRAQSAHWTFAHVAGWQKPLVELGLAGFLVGILFLFIAREVHKRKHAGELDPDGATARPAGRALARRVLTMAAVLGCRDFAGIAVFSLASIYLQKAHGLDAKRTGLILGAMMLISVFVNPLAVWLSEGKRRLPSLAIQLVIAGLVLCTTPLWSVGWGVFVLCVFQTFQLSSYAVSDAAMLERVEPHVRGRVVGIFLTLAGTFASTSPFAMGAWTDALGQRAHDPRAYLPIFITVAAMMAFAALSAPLIARLGPPVMGRIDPLTETSPETMSPVP